MVYQSNANMNLHNLGNMKEKVTPTPQGSMTRSRLKIIQEELHKELTMLQGQEETYDEGNIGREKQRSKDGRPSVDWENLSPKSKFMMSYIWELDEKLERVSRGLDSVQKDTQSVNAKVEALSREKEEKPKVASLYDSEWSLGDNLNENGGRSS
ncbi:hypothetical protein CR513_17290, partial [Mucuna pruriens]